MRVSASRRPQTPYREASSPSTDSTIEPNLIDFDEDSQSGILRCNHGHLREMRASLAFITSIGESAAAIHVDKVSGTIRSLKKGGETA